MAYENGKSYWIISQASNKALSVYGNSQVSQNRNVILWDKQEILDQSWLVSVYNGYARIQTNLNTAYSLNICKNSNNYDNCDIYTWASNLTNSQVDFQTVNANQNLYRIKLANEDRYLTTMGYSSGTDVRWKPWTGYDTQLWQLVEFGGTPPPIPPNPGKVSNMVPLPMNREFNYDQYNLNGPLVQGNIACSLTCLLDAANIFGSEPYTVAQVRVACGWNNTDGVTKWALPAGVNATVDLEYYGPAADYGSELTSLIFAYSKIRDEIDHGNLVIVRLVKQNNTEDMHFVLVYGYTNYGSSIEFFRVFDPYGALDTDMATAAVRSGKDRLQNFIVIRKN